MVIKGRPLHKVHENDDLDINTDLNIIRKKSRETIRIFDTRDQ